MKNNISIVKIVEIPKKVGYIPTIINAKIKSLPEGKALSISYKNHNSATSVCSKYRKRYPDYEVCAISNMLYIWKR